MDKHAKTVILAWIMGFIIGMGLIGGFRVTVDSWLLVIFIVLLGVTYGGILLSEIREIKEDVIRSIMEVEG